MSVALPDLGADAHRDELHNRKLVVDLRMQRGDVLVLAHELVHRVFAFLAGDELVGDLVDLGNDISWQLCGTDDRDPAGGFELQSLFSRGWDLGQNRDASISCDRQRLDAGCDLAASRTRAGA